MPSEPFAPDRAVFGEELCQAAGLVSDQMDMAKALLRHHFSLGPDDFDVTEIPDLVLRVQEALQRALGGPEILLPFDPLAPDDEPEEEPS